MRKTSRGQLQRKLTGLRGESLVRRVLSHDPKLNRRYHVHISRERGKVPGLDVKLYPKTTMCRINPDHRACKPKEFEVKTIEKLFEYEKSRQWPHTRDSRFVLKKHEYPECYVFVTEDELTNHTVVDIVKSGRVLQWMSRLRRDAKRPKLPVRAIPPLRRTPCPLVSNPHVVIPRTRT